ncbi:hypothetical protein C8J57DRAFT_1114044 [Mycena rebaudengoi]|nr:hypothetical protein C8J57DRAFT_1114044 [Mycena rebaudengoi]
MSNIAIVDDHDPLVQYGGTWVDDGAFHEFQATTKWSSTQGSTASFTFDGTSITVYGSVSRRKPPQPSMTFTIDGSSSLSGSFTPANEVFQYHQALWTSPTLSSGTHTIVVTQNAVGQNSVAAPRGGIWFDYFLYTTASTAVKSYVIDDADARIKYSGAWKRAGSVKDFQHTAIQSTAAGASLSLEFVGKSISYYGGATGNPMHASIVIDGGAAVNVVPTNPTETNNLYFSSGALSDGKHTLVITAMDTNAVWVDYFLVGPGTESGGNTPADPGTPITHTNTTNSGADTSAGAPPSNPSGTAQVGKLGSSSTGAIGAPPTGTAPDSSSSTTTIVVNNVNAGSAPSILPIVLGVVGGLLFLIALILIAVFCIRRRKRTRSAARMDISEDAFRYGSVMATSQLDVTPVVSRPTSYSRSQTTPIPAKLAREAEWLELSRKGPASRTGTETTIDPSTFEHPPSDVPLAPYDDWRNTGTTLAYQRPPTYVE